jgi:hypothetical protein
MTSGEFDAFIRSEIAEKASIIKANHIPVIN